ncbi:SAM-dependent methyltransferase [Marmoricola sp. OAE513]|uniref:class I SAM-dependent methyltransferase n=1 Tax=Marmoricola sp. OAE513 TaxID=2817894 RepID=UPI001AE21811
MEVPDPFAGFGPASPGNGVRRSPNIWDNPGTYELENTAFDRAGLLADTMRAIADWSDRDVLDVGCGTGFHLPFFGANARSVVGVEPHPPLAAIARRRTRRTANVTVLEGGAADLPLEDASVDVAHARWAYFFGPGCEPGLEELDRVVRPGGAAFVIDNDPTRSTFGGWFRRGFPRVDPVTVESFWTDRGWQRERILTDWQFDDHADFASVVRIELPTQVADEVLEEHPTATGTDYAINLWWRRF